MAVSVVVGSALADAAAASGKDCLVLAVPSKAFREMARAVPKSEAMLVSVTKGIEYDTGKTMCDVLRECAPWAKVAALSGPTFATEVARGVPTAMQSHLAKATLPKVTA